MAITKFVQEFKLRVSSKRLFKGIVTESETYLPKLIPNAIKNVETLHGDGGPGTIWKTTYVDGSPHPHAKYRIDEIDTEKNVCKYSLIEGPMVGDKFESINYDQTFTDSSDGGCIVKIVTEYHSKGDIKLQEEDIKAEKDQTLGFFTLAEETLVANPHFCT